VSQTTTNSPLAPQPTHLKSNKDIKENNKSKKPLVQDENHFVQNTNKGRLVLTII